MKNLFVWIVLISTAALGVAVAQPNHENGFIAQVEQRQENTKMMV